MKNTIHFVLQGKGGVGKSLIASQISDYIKTKTEALAAYDTDQENTTFQSYKSLNVKPVPLMTPSRTINSKKFDSLILGLLENEEPAVIDNGANTFSPLMAYIVENDIFTTLAESGKKVFIHTIVAGGDNLNDTVNGFSSLAQSTEVPLVLWLNEYFGSTNTNNGPFLETKLFKNYAEKVIGTVTICARNPQTFGVDIQNMNKLRMTVSEAIASDKFHILEKQRLKMFGRDIFNQLDQIPFSTV